MKDDMILDDVTTPVSHNSNLVIKPLLVALFGIIITEMLKRVFRRVLLFSSIDKALVGFIVVIGLLLYCLKLLKTPTTGLSTIVILLAPKYVFVYTYGYPQRTELITPFMSNSVKIYHSAEPERTFIDQPKSVKSLTKNICRQLDDAINFLKSNCKQENRHEKKPYFKWSTHYPLHRISPRMCKYAKTGKPSKDRRTIL